jgi:hypothetical protein
VSWRPGFLSGCVVSVSLLVLNSACRPSDPPVSGFSDRPNVLFISVDDLNDWIEPLGGHPQAHTPSLNRLASESVLFTRNYCGSP